VLSPDQLAIAEVTAQLERQPEGAPLYFQRADLFARRARWKEAAADMVRGLALDPSDHWNWYRSAALALQLGDRAEYERHCREMLERFGAAEAAHIAERVAKVCLISREAVEAERAARLARVAVASDSRSNIYHWFLLCGGIASYRTGDDQGAISTLRQCLDRAGANGDPYSRSAGHSFLALALHRSGDAESAGRELAAAEALVAQLPPGDGTAEIVSWNDWIFSHVAIDEAKETIRAASSK
jgi:tetratricopeptide (TPR) repeat protein